MPIYKNPENFEDYLDEEGTYQGPSTWRGTLCINSPKVKALGTLRMVTESLTVTALATGLVSLGKLETTVFSAYLSSSFSLKNLGALRMVGGVLSVKQGARLLPSPEAIFYNLIISLKEGGTAQYSRESYIKTYNEIKNAPLVSLPILRTKLDLVFKSLIDKRLKGELC